jgi:hypothetical protein
MAECFISPGHSSHSSFWSKLIDAVDESLFSLSAARYNKCPLSLQPGNLLISLALILSVEFSISIALHAATQAGDPWLLPLWDFSHHDESHPMDHDSNSSGHTSLSSLIPFTKRGGLRFARNRPAALQPVHPSLTSSVRTLKLFRVLGPKVLLMAASAASRPRAINTRPIRGVLLRAS